MEDKMASSSLSGAAEAVAKRDFREAWKLARSAAEDIQREDTLPETTHAAFARLVTKLTESLASTAAASAECKSGSPFARGQANGIPDGETALFFVGLPTELCQIGQKTLLVRHLSTLPVKERVSLAPAAGRAFARTFETGRSEEEGMDLEKLRLQLLSFLRGCLRELKGADSFSFVDSSALETAWMPDYTAMDRPGDAAYQALIQERINSSFEFATSYVAMAIEAGPSRQDALSLRAEVLHRLLAVLALSRHRRATDQNEEFDEDLDASLLVLLGRLLTDVRAVDTLMEEDRSVVEVLLGFAGAKSPKVTQALSAALARLMTISGTDEDESKSAKVLGQVVTVADKWIGGSEEEHLRGLRALTLVLLASAKYSKAVLLRPGLLPSLVDYAEAHREVTASKGRKEQTADLQRATAALIAAGCVDEEVRKVVATTSALDLLLSIAGSDSEGSPGMAAARTQALAALIKLMFVSADGPEAVDARARISSTLSIAEMVKFLSSRVTQEVGAATRKDAPRSEIDIALSNVQDAIESLVFITLQPLCKEILCRNTELLNVLIGLAKGTAAPKASPSELLVIHFGILGVLHNLSVYKPKVSEEEAHIRKIQAFAKKLDTEINPRFEDNESVDKRCQVLVSLGALDAVAAIVAQRSRSSEGLPLSTAGLVVQTVLNLTTDQQTAVRTRGLAVQRGFVPVLFRISVAEAFPMATRIAAAQCLARIAISIDPEVAFKGGQMLDVIRPIVTCLMSSRESTGLHTFEALLALTNFASVEGELGADVMNRIVAQGAMKEAEAQLLSDTVLLQRASTELFCNMVYQPEVFRSFLGAPDADRKPQSHLPSNRLKTMVALCSVDDFATRRAASGTLAILSGMSEEVCRSLCEIERAISHVCDLVRESQQPEIQHRGAEILKNLILAGGKCRESVERSGGVGLLKTLVKRGDAIGEAARTALAAQ
ncbi:armadillo-type protein [Hyaloraphidium curvatum]|nr:armadillo-type protein [Hyaloraphidium curvatum]